MLIIKLPHVLRKIVKKWHQEKKSVAFIPTMGSIHAGHIALIDAGRLYAEKIIVSIFINPMQFNCIKDFYIYPRTVQEDCKKLSVLNIDVVFIPSVTTMYPNDITYHTIVNVVRFSSILEGLSRPGHLQGVATIVSKLFNIIQPEVACFGEKDFQQLVLIRQLVYDMNYDIKIINVPTVREEDGLALSSRNVFLTSEERCIAPNLYKILQNIIVKLHKNKLCIDKLLKATEVQLIHSGFKLDQLNIYDANTLQKVTIDTMHVVILVSVWLGKTRLIDNIQISFS